MNYFEVKMNYPVTSVVMPWENECMNDLFQVWFYEFNSRDESYLEDTKLDNLFEMHFKAGDWFSISNECCIRL